VKVQALVKITSSSDGGTHLTFFRPGLSLPYAARDREHAIEVAQKFCSDFAHAQGKEWVAFWSSPDGQVNCPEGAIELPSDVWVCKLSGKMCELQAAVSIKNKAEFFGKCHAAPPQKEAIFKLVESGKYRGFHHVPGRNICVACEAKGRKKESFFYHYPWEFAELDAALHWSYEEALHLISAAKIPVNRVMCPLCASCCRELAIQLNPELAHDLVVVRVEVDLRPR
jgi:ferredoxin